jgi:hypothetical protein
VRSTGALVGALLLASLPGAIGLVDVDRAVERAEPVTLGPAAVSAASSLPSTAIGDRPITPPPVELVGEVATAEPMPEPFAAVAPSHGGGAGEVLAVIVGIDDYPGTGSDLNAAVTDANTVDAALAGFGVPVENRVLLLDGQARRPELVEALEQLAALSEPEDTIVLAYAGHVRKLDPDTEAIVTAEGGLLTDEELAAILAPSRAQRGWFLLATCYAGGFTELLAPGRIITAAAAADEVAYESPSIDGSYLVHHLVREGWLQGLAGPSVQEAFAYADARIAELYPSRRPVQLDASTEPLTLGSGTPTDGAATTISQAAPSADTTPPPTSGSAPPPSEPSSLPPLGGPKRSCTLVVFCG